MNCKKSPSFCVQFMFPFLLVFIEIAVCPGLLSYHYENMPIQIY